jgi:hypothetical protein
MLWDSSHGDFVSRWFFIIMIIVVIVYHNLLVFCIQRINLDITTRGGLDTVFVPFNTSLSFFFIVWLFNEKKKREYITATKKSALNIWCCVFFLFLGYHAEHLFTRCCHSEYNSHVIFNKYFYWELKYTFHLKNVWRQQHTVENVNSAENLFSWLLH